ncbi:hypothetical protein CIB48_g11773, partial [Xylaria polymorpha]
MTDDGPAGLADNSESASVPSQTRNSTSDRVVTCHMRGTTSTYMHGHIQGMASMHYLLYGALLSVMLGTYCTYRTVQYSTVQYWIRYPVRHRAAESGGRVVVSSGLARGRAAHLTSPSPYSGTDHGAGLACTAAYTCDSQYHPNVQVATSPWSGQPAFILNLAFAAELLLLEIPDKDKTVSR